MFLEAQPGAACLPARPTSELFEDDIHWASLRTEVVLVKIGTGILTKKRATFTIHVDI